MLLCMDTAQSACSAALFDTSGHILGHNYEEMSRGHAERLVPMITDLVSSTGRTLSDVTRVATTNGPGTFTGLRVGLAAARGFGVALHVPVVAINTLEAIAATVFASHPDLNTPLAVVIDARRAEVYVQCFGANKMPLSEPLRCTVDNLHVHLPHRPFAAAGTGAPFVQDITWPEETANEPPVITLPITAPNAVDMGSMAWRLPVPDSPPEALYLRAPDAKLPGGIIPPGFDI